MTLTMCCQHCDCRRPSPVCGRRCPEGADEGSRATALTQPLSRARVRRAKTQAARRSDSVSDSMLAALGLTSQNLPM